MLRIVEKALTFDDVLLVPAFSGILPKDVDLKTQLTKGLKLNIPLISSAMDTVTEARFAIAIAQEGGIGIIHKNLSPKEQAEEVKSVKKYEAGIINNPITINVNANLSELLHLTKTYKISSIPVLDNGNVVGIITSRDIRFTTDLSKPIKELMTPKERLITVKEGVDTATAKNILHKHRLERLLVVDENNNLKGMMTVNDIEKDRAYPLASKDSQGSLLVGAAVGTGLDSFERIEMLIDSGVDILVVDTAHGHSKGVLDLISQIKQKYSNIQIIGGNIATADAALALVKAGVDAVKVGIGPGSICTTRIIAGVGVPQISAISNVSQALKGSGIPVIADGGIRYSGDIAKAIAAGASTVMLGSIFAGTEETPGEIELYHGRSYKVYRGMGSLGAMSQGSADRYFQDKNAGHNKLVPEGIEGRVPYKGSVISVIHQMIGGLRASMGYTGCKTIKEMQTKTEFVQITGAGIKESHAHDINITKEAPNYHSQ